MESNDYIDTLLEQVRCKRAHPLVREEVLQHVEDRRIEFEASGMSAETAGKEAIVCMGDPVEAGALLDRVHRPKIPWILIVLAAILTAAGITMQAVIFPQIDNHYIASSYLTRTIIYNLLGFAVILGILFVDYTFIGRKAMWLYAAYLFGMIGVSQFYSNFGTVFNPQQYVISYYSTLFYPIVFAGLLYHLKNEGLKCLAKCAGLSFFVLIVMNQIGLLSFPGALQSAVCCIAVATAAIMKHIVSGNRKKLLAALWIPSVLLPLAVVTDAFVFHGKYTMISGYRLMRIHSFFQPIENPEGWGYMVFHVRSAFESLSLMGNKSLPAGAVTELYSDFVVTSIFSYFGILTGSIILLLAAAFVIHALSMSFRQRNRVGFLVGVACGSSILVRMIIYCMYNFGYWIWTTTAMPFLTFGFGNTLANAVIVGLLLSVYRNTDILRERGETGRFSRYKLKLIRVDK